jgi:hypothetical protein
MQFNLSGFRYKKAPEVVAGLSHQMSFVDTWKRNQFRFLWKWHHTVQLTMQWRAFINIIWLRNSNVYSTAPGGSVCRNVHMAQLESQSDCLVSLTCFYHWMVSSGRPSRRVSISCWHRVWCSGCSANEYSAHDNALAVVSCPSNEHKMLWLGSFNEIRAILSCGELTT